MIRILLAYALTVLIGATAAAWAQDAVQTVERSVKAAPNKDTQIGVYLNVLHVRSAPDHPVGQPALLRKSGR